MIMERSVSTMANVRINRLKLLVPASVLVRYAHKMLNFIRRFLASAIKKLRFIALGLTKTFYIRPIYPFVLNTFCRYVYNS